MKKAMLPIGLVVLITTQLFAQKKDSVSHKFKIPEFCFGIALGSLHKIDDFGNSFEMYGKIVQTNQWGLSMGLLENHTVSKEAPSDYRSGGFMFASDNAPRDFVSSRFVRLVREFPTKFKRIKFGVECGPAFIQENKAHFTKEQVTGNFFTNYRYITNYTKKGSLGFTLRAKVEFPVKRFFGFELGAASSINKYKTFAIVEVGIIGGKLR